MRRQIGSLNRSLSYPSILQRHSPNISSSGLTSSPLPSFTKNSLRMDSDDDFTNTIFHTISQFNNSDIETPDEFPNSELSSSTFLHSSFRPPHTSTPDEPSPAPSSYTDVTRILFPKISDQPDPSSPVKEELENQLNNFITLQLQLQNLNRLTHHHLSQSISSSESSNPASTIEETRAHRVFKQKEPNTQIFHHP